MLATVTEARVEDCFADDDDGRIMPRGGLDFIHVATIAAFGREHGAKGLRGVSP